eukprot:snap_masked-scaffold_28-processed-gene-1.15-mRNA-1 protein AED:1.00 eAED:1.00 QI:0/0/0/0/1/1/3/0/294
MNSSSDCESPFLLDEDGFCTLTVYEFYEPFTYYLRKVSIILDLLMFFGLLGILISFLKTHKKHWCSNQRVSIRIYSDREGHFFNGLAKRNCVCIVYMASFFYSGTFTFFPILKELLGLTKSSPKNERIQTVSLIIFFIITLPFVLSMPYLIYAEILSFSMINGILLSLVMYSTVNIAIKGAQKLTEHYAKQEINSKEINKLYTFKLKLIGLKAAITIHSVFLILITLPNLFSKKNTTKLILLIDSIYLTIIPIELIPSVFFYSKFILPGSDQCFSFEINRDESCQLDVNFEAAP